MSVSDANASLDELRYLEDGRRVAFAVDESVYPLDAVYGAAYLFLDRCFLYVHRVSDGVLEVRLKPKAAPAGPEALETLAGEFANALLDQVVRVQVARSTGRIREYYMARAFLSAPASASIDALLAELDQEELAADALEIDVPWQAGGRSE
jgi:His-Xaa-Ser system protein HxsD